MSNALEQDIRDFVMQKVANGDNFTAFDVTKEAGLAKHRYVKPIVHAMFENGELDGYTREIDNSIDGQPFRYSPASVLVAVVEVEDEDETEDWDATNPNHPDYCMICKGSCKMGQPQRNRNNVGNVSPIKGGANFAASKATDAKVATNAKPVSYEATVNENGTRLRIRKEAVAAAGFKAGDKVTIIHLGNELQITNKPVTTNAETQSVIVDVKNNIRVNLDKFGIEAEVLEVVPVNVQGGLITAPVGEED